MGHTARPRTSRATPGRPPREERDARLAARRNSLIDAATAAIEADGENATMTRMAAQAGVTKAVLYRHFNDRAGLYEVIARRFAETLLADLQSAIAAARGRERVRAGIDAYFAHLEQNPGTYRFLTQRVPAHSKHGAQLVTGFIQRVGTELASLLATQPVPAADQPGRADILGHGITGMVQRAGEAWLNTTIPRQHAVDYLTDTLWQGLSGPSTT